MEKTYNIYTRNPMTSTNAIVTDLELKLTRDQLIEFQLAVATILRVEDTYQGISINNDLNLFVQETK